MSVRDISWVCCYVLCLYDHLGLEPHLFVESGATEAAFASGTSIAELGMQNVPLCISLAARHAVSRLENSDNSLVVGESNLGTRGAFGAATVAGWNTTAFNVLRPSLSGVYKCKSPWAESQASWTLYVAGNE